MIKALQGNKIILGLSDENLRRLKNNEPIRFNLNELGIGDYDVIIFNGKTEQSMKESMKDKITHRTIIKSNGINQN